MPRNPESNFWDRVRPLLAGLDPVRIESSVSSGMPDVNCTLGWIELKQVRGENIPKRATTVLRIDHFTPEQRSRLTRRTHFRGAAWLLLLLGEEWLLFTGRVAADKVGRVTADEARALACRRWEQKPSLEDFQQSLRDTAADMVAGRVA